MVEPNKTSQSSLWLLYYVCICERWYPMLKGNIVPSFFFGKPEVPTSLLVENSISSSFRYRKKFPAQVSTAPAASCDQVVKHRQRKWILDSWIWDQSTWFNSEQTHGCDRSQRFNSDSEVLLCQWQLVSLSKSWCGLIDRAYQQLDYSLMHNISNFRHHLFVN